MEDVEDVVGERRANSVRRRVKMKECLKPTRHCDMLKGRL